MADSHKNFAYSTVATAPSPAISGTSLVVAAGGGTLFPTPPCNASIWPASAQPTTANAEIVRVTAIATDTLTITRAQESSSARTVVVGDQIAATVTAKTLTDVETMTVGGSLAGALPNPRFAPGKTQNMLTEALVASMLAESMPHWMIASNVNILNTGRLTSVAVPVLNGTACTSASFVSATTAVVTPTNWWFALCDASLNPIRQSTDQLTAAWTANTLKTLTLDSIPVTAGARSASTTVTLTFPTLSESLTSLIAVNDSVVVSNANIAAYNGTFTVASVTSTQITYVSGGSATDSLVAPFPTVQLAAGKRVYSATADGVLYAVIMVKATTVPTTGGYSPSAGTGSIIALAPVICGSGNSGLTGTVPSPITNGTGTGGIVIWGAIS